MTVVMAQSSRTEAWSHPPRGTLSHYDDAAASPHDRLRGVIEDIVSNVFSVRPEQLRRATRGRANIALARQVAMYIAHVGYGMSLTEVGRLFERDRTTVAHAFGVVEIRRDDPDFDGAVVLLELIVRTVNGCCSAGEAGSGGSGFGAS